MTYSAIGLMVAVHLTGWISSSQNFRAGPMDKTKLQLYSFSSKTKSRLANAIHLPANEYATTQILPDGVVKKTNEFLKKNKIRKKPQIIGSRTHYLSYPPGMTHQLGDGATIAVLPGPGSVGSS